MTRKVHAHLPWVMFEEGLPFFIERGVNPEIFLPVDALEAFLPEKGEAAAEALAAAGLSCTIHSPFMDLNPGSFEPLLREATVRRFAQVMEAAAILHPKAMVFHPGYDRWRYGEQKKRWLEQSIPVWETVVRQAESIGTVIAVENIFEEEPSTLRELLEAIPSPAFRHCFDAGHWNLFSPVPLEEWFEELGSYVAELHLHDNGGKKDDHAPPGEGSIDFQLLFSLISRHAPEAILTIEAHNRNNLEKSLLALSPYLKQMEETAIQAGGIRVL